MSQTMNSQWKRGISSPLHTRMLLAPAEPPGGLFPLSNRRKKLKYVHLLLNYNKLENLVYLESID